MPIDTLVPEQENRSPDRDRVIVERLRIGETPVTVLLMEHTDKFAELIETNLSDCDIIAIEQPGHNNAKRRRDEDTARIVTPGLQQSINNLAQNPHKRFMLLDIHQDDPDYPAVIDTENARDECAQSIADLDSVSRVRALLVDTARKTAHSDTIRDTILRQQLLDLPQTVGDAKVGIVLGAMHYRAIEGLNDSSGPISVALRVQAVMTPHEQLVETCRNNIEPSSDLIDQAVLWTYLRAYVSGSNNTKIITQLASNPEVVQNLLAHLDKLAVSTLQYEEKAQEVRTFLQSVTEILSDY